MGTTIKRKMIKRLENASKHAAATATQCIAASQGAGGHNTNGMSQDELMESCKAVADVIPRLVLVLIFLRYQYLVPRIHQPIPKLQIWIFEKKIIYSRVQNST